MFLMAIFKFIRILFRYADNTPELCTIKRWSMETKRFIFCLAVLSAIVSCEVKYAGDESEEEAAYQPSLEEVAEVLSALPIQKAQLDEVHDAVSASSANGYDEEYTMRLLFASPGSGVGDKEVRSESSYERPLRSLIEDHVRSQTKSSAVDPDRFLDALIESDMQIYWPYSEDWNGEDMPLVTFDPEDGAEANIGYRLVIENDGSRHVEEVVVDEEMAKKVPVWVVNRNSDAGYTSLEMLRREDPDWGEGGGSIIVSPKQSSDSETRASDVMRTLILKDFTMKRNYDSWFAGASEFFVKIGYLEDFTASTEAELRFYSPMITDFMIVVKRNQVGIPQNFNAILMSDWSEQSDACAFMITEDDGGTRTEWTSKAKVFVEGKSYGVEITIPLNMRDDIVWRGKMAYDWFEKCDGQSWPFGDVDLTFEIVEN